MFSVDCLMPNCSGNGVCVGAQCLCWRGYTGPDCSLTEPDNVTVCSPNCSGRGVFYPSHQNCTCAPGWTGPQCEIGEWENNNQIKIYTYIHPKDKDANGIGYGPHVLVISMR